MTENTGAVYDLGYEPFDGERMGRSGARRTIFADGIRRTLGIRRKARHKIMPWTLLFFAVVPPIVAVGIAFMIPAGTADSLDIGAQNSGFFTLAGTMAMLFAALAAPELLIPDRRDGVLSMLASRPLTAADYLGTRFASLAAVVGAFMIIPQLVLFLGQAATDPHGLLRGIINAADTLPRIVAVAAIYTVAYIPIAFAVASLSNRRAIASASYLAVMLALTAFGEAIVRGSNIAEGRWVALLAPINTADAANAWIFGETNSGSLLAAADIHPAAGIVALGAIGIGASIAAYQRYRRLL